MDDHQQTPPSHPDQLDRLIASPPSVYWLTLSGLFLCMITALLWAFSGHITITATGKGLLVRPGGVFDIKSLTEGQVISFNKHVGDIVKKGDIIATVDKVELESLLKQTQKEAQFIRELIDKDDLLPANKKLSTDRKEQYQFDYLSLQQSIKQLELELAESTSIRSHYTGTILDIFIDEGEFITLGQSILQLEKLDETLQVVLYIPSDKARDIRPNMTALIDPNNVPKERYGHLKGTVSFVSKYPSTKQGMMRLLRNDAIVTNLLRIQSPIKVIIDLTPDKHTKSGYAWTTSQGPESLLHSGSTCSGFVITDTYAPISFIFPRLRQWVHY